MRKHVAFVSGLIRLCRHLALLLIVAEFLVMANRAHAQTVTATVNVGFAPGTLVVNPTTNKVYVSGAVDSIAVIDGVSNSASSISTSWLRWESQSIPQPTRFMWPTASQMQVPLP